MSDQVQTQPEGPSSLRRALRRVLTWAGLALATFAVIPRVPSFATSADRELYFKLPIEGARFHWMFRDPEAFLSGELTLRILNEDRDQTLVVFRDGKIQPGWEMIGETRPDLGFYFGFSSTTRVRTKANDSLIVTLTATQDLRGQGPHSEGVLAAGVWQMTGTYSSMYGGQWNPVDYFVLHGDPPIAFMECWTGVWPITITKNEGWKGAAPPDKPSLFRKLTKGRGTNGRRCGSHI